MMSGLASKRQLPHPINATLQPHTAHATIASATAEIIKIFALTATCSFTVLIKRRRKRGVAAQRRRSAMRRRGVRFATKTKPAHSLQQKLGSPVNMFNRIQKLRVLRNNRLPVRPLVGANKIQGPGQPATKLISGNALAQLAPARQWGAPPHREVNRNNEPRLLFEHENLRRGPVPGPARWAIKIHEQQVARVVFVQPWDISVIFSPLHVSGHVVADRGERIRTHAVDVRKRVVVAVEVHALLPHPHLEPEHDPFVAIRPALHEVVVGEPQSEDDSYEGTDGDIG